MGHQHHPNHLTSLCNDPKNLQNVDSELEGERKSDARSDASFDDSRTSAEADRGASGASVCDGDSRKGPIQRELRNA